MNAIVIDFKDRNTRTLNQAVRVFYSLYDQETVRQILTKVFSDYTAMTSNGKPKYDEQAAVFITLFDHLISLVGAIEVLRQTEIKGKCIICNRTGNLQN